MTRAGRTSPGPAAHLTRETAGPARPSLPGARKAAALACLLLAQGVGGARTLAGQDAGDDARDVELHIPYTQFTLPNGLNVIVHQDRTAPLVAVNVWYHVGSKDERPGRTGFAHLFEHVMFEGSAHVPEGEFDRLLEAAGGVNNGSTSPDRTNYWQTVPSNALELALWLEADRMGWLLEVMDQGKLDVQRDVVRNERRQSYENRPYGLAHERILAALYPEDHPYHWPVIGSMEDLAAATLVDVQRFFRAYYSPANASLAVAGDVSPAAVRRLVDRYFAEIPAGAPVSRPDPPDATLGAERRQLLEDDVTLPRLYMAWHSPRAYAPGDAEMELAARVLAEGRASRLHRRLVYREELAESVRAWQEGQELGGSFQVVATARPGVGLDALERAVREELERIAVGGVEAEELERAVRLLETEMARELESVGGFGGRADRLNEYFFLTGNPGFLRRHLAGIRSATPAGVAEAARRHLVEAHGVVLSVVPRGRTDLAAGARSP